MIYCGRLRGGERLQPKSTQRDTKYEAFSPVQFNKNQLYSESDLGPKNVCKANRKNVIFDFVT